MAFTTLVDHNFGSTAQQTVSWALAGYDYFLVRVQQVTQPATSFIQVAISGPTWRTSGYERHGVSSGTASEVSDTGCRIWGGAVSQVNFLGHLLLADKANYLTSLQGLRWAGNGANAAEQNVQEYATAEAHAEARFHNGTGNFTAGRLLVIGVSH